MNQKELLIISITVFLTIVAWIIADLFHIATTERVKIVSETISEPIDISIDTELFDVLERRN